jgi:hypothetical protein
MAGGDEQAEHHRERRDQRDLGCAGSAGSIAGVSSCTSPCLARLSSCVLMARVSTVS